jgi:peptide/nickel transport system permease protein
MRRARKNVPLLLGGAMSFLFLLVAVFHGFLSPYGVEQMDMAHRLATPSAAHWLGSDNFGRDLGTRLAYGAGVSLSIAMGTVGAASVFGTSFGLVAGYVGGKTDLLMMRLVDIFLGFPTLVLAMAIIAMLGPGPLNLAVALATVFWTQYARVARAAMISERGREYVEAARAIGAGHPRIVLRHVFPNMFGPLLVLATLGIGTAIVSESGLSFLGLGVQPPTPTWGWTLAYGTRYLRSNPWMSIAAGLTIMLAVTAFNLLGDGLRDFLDPRGLAGREARLPRVSKMSAQES